MIVSETAPDGALHSKRRRDGKGARKAGRWEGTLAGHTNAELKALVVEASRALASLDAARLEELALCCEALNRKLVSRETDPRLRTEMARQAQDAVQDMAVFRRVLEATRANLSVMNRLREMRMGKLEYTVWMGGAVGKSAVAEKDDGNH